MQRHPVSGLRRDNTYPGRSVPRPSSSGSAIRSRSSPQSLSISEPWNEEVHSLHDQEIVRAITGIPPGVALSLSSADSPSSGLKETKKYKQLVILAIWESASRRLTLQEIYDAMTQRFPLFASMNEHKAPWKVGVESIVKRTSDLTVLICSKALDICSPYTRSSSHINAQSQFQGREGGGDSI